MRVIINKFHVYGFVSNKNRLKRVVNGCSHFLDALYDLQRFYDEHPGQYELDRDWCDDDEEDYCEE